MAEIRSVSLPTFDGQNALEVSLDLTAHPKMRYRIAVQRDKSNKFGYLRFWAVAHIFAHWPSGTNCG
jgi:hypothetical protein